MSYSVKGKDKHRISDIQVRQPDGEPVSLTVFSMTFLLEVNINKGSVVYEKQPD